MCVLGLSVFTPARASVFPLFSSTFTSYGTGEIPSGFVATDLNGDLRLDLAIANGGSSTITVLLGDGKGSFIPGVSFFPGERPYDLAAGDMNGDGRPDLVIAHNGFSGGSVSVMLARGDGQFDRGFDVVNDGASTDVAIGDLDNDADLDIAFVDYWGTGRIGILTGHGDGTFDPARTIAAIPRTFSIAIGDVNNDRRPDLVVIGDSGLFLMMGNGDGTFQATRSLASSTGGYLTLADLNRDGLTDILAVAGTYPNGSVIASFGRADGVLLPAVNLGPTTTLGAEVAVGDLNRDGIPDLALSSSAAAGVLMFLGGPGGQFVPAGRLTTGNRSARVGLTDVGGDGLVDLVALDRERSLAIIATGNGDGSFGSDHPLEAGREARWVVSGDLNDDHIPDLAVAEVNDRSVAVLLSRGDGTFEPGARVPTGLYPVAIALADFDRDGRLDLATMNAGDGTTTVSFNLGGGQFGRSVDIPVGGDARTVASGDFNGDGIADLEVDKPPGRIGILIGEGDGRFTTAPDIQVDFTINYDRSAVGDFDEDGRSDLVSIGPFECCGYDERGKRCTCYSEVAALHMSNGDGTFRSRPLGLGMDPGSTGSVRVGDIDADGHLDILVSVSNVYFAYPHVTGVQVLLGNGDGIFRGPRFAATPRMGQAMAAADCDGDGLTDIAVVDATSAWISLADGHGGFEATPAGYGTSIFIESMCSGDFNQDGRTDLAVAGSSGVRILFNVGGEVPPPHAPARLVATPGEASTTLSWPAVEAPRLSGYRVYYGRVSDPVPLAGDEAAEGRSGLFVPAPATTLVLHCLPDTAFSFKVTAVGENGKESRTGAGASAIPARVGGTLTIRPKWLRLRSHRRLWARLRLDPGFAVENVIVSSIRLNGNTSPTRTLLTDVDGDGRHELLIGFRKDDLQIPSAEPVPFILTGALSGCRDSIWFEARDTIWVKHRGTLAAEDSDRDDQEGEESEALAGTLTSLPVEFALHSPAPSPTASACDFAFDLPVATLVQLLVFDVNGRRVAMLIDRWTTAGRHRVRWDVTVEDGVYFARLSAGRFQGVQRVVVVR